MFLSTRIKVLSLCLLATIAIAVFDWLNGPDISLGILYLAPVLVSAIFLSRRQVFVYAVAVAILRQRFGPVSSGFESLLRFSTGLLMFAGAGVLVAELMRRRRFEADYMQTLKEAIALRRGAEEDARVVVETSPAAILTIKADGTIDLANEAARRLLCFDSGLASSQNIRQYFPMLAEMLKSHRGPSFLRAMVEGQGRRGNGEMFFCHMWLSSYSTPAGPKLAAVVGDVSEQVREREELGLRQLLMNSHIIASAVSHEVRNLAAAAGTMYDNLAHSCEITENDDFTALGHLIEGMRKLCSSEIPVDNDQSLTGVDLNALFKELDIILKASSEDAAVEVQWNITENLPRVRAHHLGLVQVFLNLTQNSRRALRNSRNPYITVVAYPIGASVMVMIADNGPGIPQPEMLFQPFQFGASSTGLGLYVSRAIVRTYGGELRFVRRSLESCFEVELPILASMEVPAIA